MSASRDFKDNLLEISRGRLEVFERTTDDFLTRLGLVGSNLDLGYELAEDADRDSD